MNPLRLLVDLTVWSVFEVLDGTPEADVFGGKF